MVKQAADVIQLYKEIEDMNIASQVDLCPQIFKTRSEVLIELDEDLADDQTDELTASNEGEVENADNTDEEIESLESLISSSPASPPKKGNV